METTLHRQLKLFYGGTTDCTEVACAGYRIDAVVEGRLIEIQQASLGALRDKIRVLTSTHEVVVVKPLPRCIWISGTNSTPGGRRSPRQGTWVDLFEDLVHFATVFPHPKLTLEVVLVDLHEQRAPRPAKRRRRNSHRLLDRSLRCVVESRSLRTADDLWLLLPSIPASPFTTADLAAAAGVSRWIAQKIAYCLRVTGAAVLVGKQRNALVYEQVIEIEPSPQGEPSATTEQGEETPPRRTARLAAKKNIRKVA